MRLPLFIIILYFFNYPISCSTCVLTFLSDMKFDVHFICSTSEGKDEKFDSSFDPKNVNNFLPKSRTTIIVLGFLADDNMPAARELQRQLLASNDTNVIMFDWSEGSQVYSYEQAVYNTIHAADHLRSGVKKIFEYWKSKGLERKAKIHIIGHSLGAHVAGQAGKKLKELDNIIIDRITGLDPAEPCFETQDGVPKRLYKSDAKFVDVIHTDGARFKNTALGLYDTIGHADFYLNGGAVQPECTPDNRNIQVPTTTFWVLNRLLNYVNIVKHVLSGSMLCNHMRAMDVFVETVRNSREFKDCQYIGFPWNRDGKTKLRQSVLQCHRYHNVCPEMGMNSENGRYKNTTSNSYFVSTKERRKHCLKYFSDFSNGTWSEKYKVKPYTEEMNHYIKQGIMLTKEKFYKEKEKWTRYFGKLAEFLGY